MLIIMVDGEEKGAIYRDDQYNYQVLIRVKLNFGIRGYNHTSGKKTWKEAKKEAERLC